ncbi:uncharacterized protein PV06_02258 [Exophiala oligosperma]|uniref:Transcription factor domain-containing protein n=1 Tax=Exophiala oligosperma TaxID=215243 RepID=A0A0D2DTV1_9EURO|nr:uncharacterized protein PV06_02258 [Exophiala oligosperma]KIW46593.1 hypothetical protein PV06_02258 [Exophiala oligosperma]
MPEPPSISHESSVQPLLAFISQSSRTGRVDRETQRRVHSHAQANYRRRTSRRKHQNTVELNVAPPLRRDSTHAELTQHRQHPSPATILDASRTDPFETFALQGGRRAHQLWDHVYDGTCQKFRALIAIGFIDLVRESTALSQMLSASAWHLVHFLRCEDDTGDDAKYSLISNQALQRKLNDIVTGTSDDVVTAVLAAAAYANLIKDAVLFQTHMDGLSHILQHRGGEQTLDACPALRLGLFWIETNGRFKQDSIPIYPLPYHLLVGRTKLNPIFTDLSRLSTNDKVIGDMQQQHSCNANAITKAIFDRLRQLTETVDKESPSVQETTTTTSFWLDSFSWVYTIQPLLYELLSLPRATRHDSPLLRRGECLRLGAILYVCNIRYKLDPEPGTAMLHGTKLYSLLGSSPNLLSSWSDSDDAEDVATLIWILTAAACSVTLFDDLRREFAVLLSTTLRSTRIVTTFREFYTLIHRFPWSRAVLGSELRNLHDELDLID